MLRPKLDKESPPVRFSVSEFAEHPCYAFRSDEEMEARLDEALRALLSNLDSNSPLVLTSHTDSINLVIRGTCGQ